MQFHTRVEAEGRGRGGGGDGDARAALQKHARSPVLFLGGPMQLVRKQLRQNLKAARKLCRSVLLRVSCTLATSLVYSKIGGLQLSCELVDMSMGR